MVDAATMGRIEVICSTGPHDEGAGEVAELVRGVAESLAAAGTSLPEAIAALGPYLTDVDDPVRRSRATQVMAALVGRSAAAMEQSQAAAVAQFFADRLGDFSSVLPSLEGLFSLATSGALQGEAAALPWRAPLRELHVPSLDRIRRQRVIEIVDACLNSHASVAALDAASPTTIADGSAAAEAGAITPDGSWEELLTGFVAAIDGERDPRCLVTGFQALARLLAEVCSRPGSVAACSASGIFRECLEVVAVYFPVSFTPPADDPHGITREGLSAGLEGVLCSCLPIAVLALPLVTERLAAAKEGPSAVVEAARRDAASAVAGLAVTLGPRGLAASGCLAELASALAGAVADSPAAFPSLAKVLRAARAAGRNSAARTGAAAAWGASFDQAPASADSSSVADSAAPSDGAPAPGAAASSDAAARAAAERGAASKAVAGPAASANRLPPALVAALRKSGATEGVAAAAPPASSGASQPPSASLDWTASLLNAGRAVLSALSRGVEATGDRAAWDAFVSALLEPALAELRDAPGSLRGRSGAATITALASASTNACAAMVCAAVPVVAKSLRETARAEEAAALVSALAGLVTAATIAGAATTVVSTKGREPASSAGAALGPAEASMPRSVVACLDAVPGTAPSVARLLLSAAAAGSSGDSSAAPSAPAGGKQPAKAPASAPTSGPVVVPASHMLAEAESTAAAASALAETVRAGFTDGTPADQHAASHRKGR
ncbi:hypothetical protein FNF31_06646 [Cafeteria roenbergensis]|uniref:MMS19 nucleotide excision repair protein n=1 Tax=Cafeteria roenbergensis TaxID=33653 RepID=A0A5A8CKC1_CAFRO|nr:hypothetical protein FNF31_06646 [Cafeteria roenbergensis]